MEGIKAYQCYQALKLHFTSDYDFIKYGGKVRKISDEAFLKRKDQYLFRKLERKYDDKELIDFFVSNFISQAGVRWVGEMNGTESEKVYNAWKGRMETFSYHLKQDLEYIKENSDWKNCIGCKGSHPELMKMYLGGKIKAETVIAFDILTGDMLERWNALIDDPIIWPEVYRQLSKYRPFVRIDREVIKKVMRNVFPS
jgi:hypothetical protein